MGDEIGPRASRRIIMAADWACKQKGIATVGRKGAKGARVQGGYPLFAPFAPLCQVCALLPDLHPSASRCSRVIVKCGQVTTPPVSPG